MRRDTYSWAQSVQFHNVTAAAENAFVNEQREKEFMHRAGRRANATTSGRRRLAGALFMPGVL